MLNLLQYRIWAISNDFSLPYQQVLLQWINAGHAPFTFMRKKSMEDHTLAIEGLLAQAADVESVDINSAQSTVRFDQNLGLPVLTSENKNIALLPISGVITKNGDLCSFGTKDYQAWLSRANASASIDAIMLLIDSPGGSVDGTQELAQAVKDSAKPVGVFIDGLMASAAYWIGSQAQGPIIANRYNTNKIGSIGTYGLYQNISGKMEKDGIKAEIIRASKSTKKVTVNPLEPLTAEGRASIQSEVDDINEVFISYVQKARPDVDEKVFEADAYDAYKAKQLGLIDGLGTMQTAVNKLVAFSKEKAKAQAQASQDVKLQNLAAIPTSNNQQTTNSMTAEEAKKQEEQKLATLEASLKAEQTARATAEQSLASANEKISALEAEKAALATQVSEKEAALATANAEVTTLKAKLDEAPAGQRTTAVSDKDNGAENNVKQYLTSVDAELEQLKSLNKK